MGGGGGVAAGDEEEGEEELPLLLLPRSSNEACGGGRRRSCCCCRCRCRCCRCCCCRRRGGRTRVVTGSAAAAAVTVAAVAAVVIPIVVALAAPPPQQLPRISPAIEDDNLSSFTDHGFDEYGHKGEKEERKEERIEKKTIRWSEMQSASRKKLNGFSFRQGLRPMLSLCFSLWRRIRCTRKPERYKDSRRERGLSQRQTLVFDRKKKKIKEVFF